MPVANVRFKGQYHRYILFSFITAVAIHFLVFYYSPPFTFQPYVFKEKPVTCIVPAEPVAEVVSEPEDIPQPPVVPEIASDAEEVDEDVVIPRTSLKSITDIVFTKPVDESKPFHPFQRPPVLVRVVSPVYPKMARMGGFEGTVLLKVLVGTDGSVKSASVIHSDVTRKMEEAAVAAVKFFVFEPAIQGTVPVQAFVEVPIIFKLN